MRWFCTGHFVATWLVSLGLLLRFQKVEDHSVTLVIFAVVLWPVFLWLLPMKGYFALKEATLDRLKARVSHGDLKKVVVFGFGFATSMLAALAIMLSTWVLGEVDDWFRKRDGIASIAHHIAWFATAFALWAVTPVLVLRHLAKGGKDPEPAAATTQGN